MKVYDAQTLQYVKSLPSGPDPELLTLHPDGKRVYIANEDDNLVTVVDIEFATAWWQRVDVRRWDSGGEYRSLAGGRESRYGVRDADLSQPAFARPPVSIAEAWDLSAARPPLVPPSRRGDD